MLPISKIAEPIRQAATRVKSWGKAMYRHWKIRREQTVKPLIPDLDEYTPKAEKKSLRGKRRYHVSTATDTSNKITREELIRLWEGPPVENLPPQPEQTPPVPLKPVAPDAVQPEETRTEESRDEALEEYDPLREEARLNKELKQQKRLETALGAGAAGGALATGAALATASELQPSPAASDFDHILKKDTPIDQMVTFFQHNSLSMVDKGSLPVVTNQTMSIEETLDKTPVRGFDIDLHVRNDEVVINHGGYYNPLVPDENIPRLHDAIEPINDWLERPGNSHEVIFLNFENRELLNDWEMREVFGDKIIHGYDYDNLVARLGRAPTINELTADGPKVFLISNDHFITPGVGDVGLSNWHHIPSLWEDRSLAEILGPEYHDDVAPKITTEDVDTLIEKGQGRFISLDQISPNDPRFLKPEDRADHALKTDNTVFGHLYYSDEQFQSALVGVGTTASVASGALGVAGGVFQGVNNERQIRRQPKEVAQHLHQVSLLDILQKRKKKDLDKPVTPEEIQRLYTRSKKGEITRRTLIPGISGTVSVSGSLLGLGMIFAPVFPALAATAAATGVTGLAATIGAAISNRRRMSSAIRRSFESTTMKNLTEFTALKLEGERQKLEKSVTEGSDVKSANVLLLKTLKKRGRLNRLQKLSQFILGGSLVVRISGLSKYGLPILGTVAMGAGAALTGILTIVSAAVNFKERRQRLADLPGTVAEVLNPKLGSKRFWLFGKSRLERYLQKNAETIKAQQPALAGMSVKQMMKTLNDPEAPAEKLAALHECRKQSSTELWEKKLIRFAKKRKPYRHFMDIRKKPEELRALLKEFAIKEVGRFAHDDTFRSGRNNTAKLALLGAFGGVFYLPLIGIGAGTLLVGLGVSKVVAEVERQVFKKKLRRTIREPGSKPADQAAHKAVNGLVNAWTNMLVTADEPDKTKGAEEPPLSEF